MKVLNRGAFLSLPPGTIYAKGELWCFDGLRIKYETTEHDDWWSLDPCWVATNDSDQAVDGLEDMLENGASRPMEDAVSRDGLHQQGALFLVFERDDLLRLREMVDEALGIWAERKK
jgi:hypothetical protein